MPEVAAVRSVPWEKGEAGRELHIQSTNGMQFAQKELLARAGERLTLTFDNPDAMLLTGCSSNLMPPPSPLGRFPYLCTFPGHWMAMRGTLIVE